MLGPAELVARARGAGLTIISVTDHDTLAGLEEARQAAEAHGIRLVDGIEITAVEGERDVHMLGYFFDPANHQLAEFLEAQRADRIRRVHDMAARLADLGVPVDASDILARAARQHGRSVGRPQLADALIAAGHALNRDDAFGRFLGDECPAFVPRRGASPDEVVAIVRAAGGIASVAHPALLGQDAIIPRLGTAGLAAIEVCHSDHDEEAERHYRALASSLGLAASGGSDFHGDHAHRTADLGRVTLPLDDFTRLEACRT